MEDMGDFSQMILSVIVLVIGHQFDRHCHAHSSEHVCERELGFSLSLGTRYVT